MRGTIRVGVGFCLLYGAVGTLDYDPTANVLLAATVGVLGLALMCSGVRAMNAR